MEQKLVISIASYVEILPKLVASGVTYDAKEVDCNQIEIVFTGGY